MKTALSVFLAGWSLFLVLPAPAAAQPPAAPAGESERLHRLFDTYWESKLRETPEFATYIGFPGHNDRWSDFSPAGIERRRTLAREHLKTAQAIDRGRLSAEEQVDLDLLRRRLESQIEGFRFPTEQTMLTQVDGIQHDVPRALATAPTANTRDYEDRLARLKALPDLVDQNIALLEKGRAAGVTSPRSMMQGVPDQVRALLTDDPWQSPLLTPFRQISPNIPVDDQTRLRREALRAYDKKAAPAFRKLLSYLTSTYIPGARESISVAAVPDGAAWYAYALRKATTTDLTPEQVHETGLSEVKRLRTDMEKVIADSGFQGSFAEFVKFLHTDPRFFYDKAEDLLEGYRAISARAESRLPSLFVALPTLAFRVRAIPERIARSRATAYYEPGSASTGLPGTCFINTFDLKARPKWEMEALALHECVPGHHLQVSLAQEMKKAPRWRNYHDYTAFVEGWGLYAETLGDEMGFYRDPYFKFGQLSYEMWRAVRLVVDTGIHSRGWTKQQAFEYFRENTAQNHLAIEAEINRYVASPGFAPAYKLGELKIQELRVLAQRELGPAFDLRAFHDEVLRHGAVPLDLLAQNVAEWMATRKAQSPGAVLSAPLAAAADPAAEYLERYFDFYPTRATASGRHDLDEKLEDLSPERRTAWSGFNRQAAEALRRRLNDPATPFDDRLDAELLLRQAETEILDYETLRRPERDPLFWTGFLGETTIYLLVREDLPPADRLQRVAARADLIPRLARQAREALGGAAPSAISSEISQYAVFQTRAYAALYRDNLLQAGEGQPEALKKRLAESGGRAAAALDELAVFLEELTKKASGSPRLGSLYAERFRTVTGIQEPVDDVLSRAEAALVAKRAEAAAYGRSVWKEIFPEAPLPADDREVVRRLFERIAVDRAQTTEEFIEDYRKLTDQAIEFVRAKKIMTLPEPTTLSILRSPGYLFGQAVGGVYPAGPYAPEAATLYYLPTPPDAATPAERDAFFRDFNHHFNVMITSHEIIPGHYTQLKLAARHPRKVRALFADGVYVEGWGTFCERLMLDLGWGGPLDRVAHLKKQMENIARTVVDIRVHTRGMAREEVLRYVREEALQDEHFAANMWARALTSSPQLTFYHLGYHQVMGLYEDVRKAQGARFDLRTFMDGMMEMGPVPVERYRRKMLQ